MKSISPATPGVPIPPGYQQDGACTEMGLDAKTGKASMLRCVHKNGEVIIWRNPEKER